MAMRAGKLISNRVMQVFARGEKTGLWFSFQIRCQEKFPESGLIK